MTKCFQLRDREVKAMASDASDGKSKSTNIDNKPLIEKGFPMVSFIHLIGQFPISKTAKKKDYQQNS